MYAENVADCWLIGRDEQDRFAIASQHKATNALRDEGLVDLYNPDFPERDAAR